MPAEAHAVQAYCTMFDFPAPGRPVTITTCPWRNRMPASWRAPSAATSGSAAPETAARRRLLLGLSIEGVGERPQGGDDLVLGALGRVVPGADRVGVADVVQEPP